MSKTIGASLVALAAGLAGLSAIPAHAQAGAGTVEERNRGGAGAVVPGQDRPGARIDYARGDGPAPELPACGSATCVEVRAIRLDGGASLPAAELERLLPALPARFDLTGLRASAARIASYYRDRGYLVARVFVPQQELTGGTVVFQIVEGRLESRDPVSAASAGAADGAVGAVRANLCGDDGCGGEPLRRGALERALLIAGDVTGRQVGAILRPGAEPGTTHLEVTSEPRRKPLVTAGVDNFGARSVGEWRFSAGLAKDNLLQAGDTASLRAMTSDKTNFTSVTGEYSAALGQRGLRITGGASYSDYTLGNEFAILKATGTATGGRIGLSYPLVRQLDATLTVRVEGGYVRLNDRILGVRNQRDLATVQLGLGGQVRDSLLGRPALTMFDLAYVRGDLWFQNRALDTAGARGVSDRLIGQFSRVQSLVGPVTLSGNAFGQLASDNLDPYMKMSIGGPAAVRAYPVGEVSGDKAAVVQVALGVSQALPADHLVSLRVFYDHGWARLALHPVKTSGNLRSLAGGGVEVTLSRADRYSLTVFAARVMGTGASAIDGKRERFGLTVGTAF